MRRLNRKKTLNLVKELDAFPKVPQSYVETSASGGTAYNFSHRIDHLSFGELVPGIINPLDGTEKIAMDHNQMFQYFITVVPTKLHTYKISADTHQFSVTERVPFEDGHTDNHLPLLENNTH
ncbi:Endoplasmic reticulum-Golgi intermediate compartment protein 2 [Fukomys damarensis]|uniref:Endoplasmic reticulum-Golgi intermediate compartment protein n=1 Tax=Fukomys damarensis TaxID=885580 RepID=A0A091DLW7_FUKDA|nr:Endoplasmic reticulum-Golgi intermediate compartment protein 2 [Fukomys damarensis]